VGVTLGVLLTVLVIVGVGERATEEDKVLVMDDVGVGVGVLDVDNDGVLVRVGVNV
jgi:hypothetical protein